MIGKDFVRCDWCGKYEWYPLASHTQRPPIPQAWAWQGKGHDLRIFCCKEHQEAFNAKYQKEAVSHEEQG